MTTVIRVRLINKLPLFNCTRTTSRSTVTVDVQVMFRQFDPLALQRFPFDICVVCIFILLSYLSILIICTRITLTIILLHLPRGVLPFEPIPAGIDLNWSTPQMPENVTVQQYSYIFLYQARNQNYIILFRRRKLFTHFHRGQK